MANPPVEPIIEFLKEKFNPSECDAVDVGCGTKEGTIPLAPFLRHVVGLDPSEEKINKLKSDSKVPSNVEFRVGEAEDLPFKDSSLQLVTVKSALHRFNIPKFFQEVDRVLQPGGVLAVSCGKGTVLGQGSEEFSHVLTSIVQRDGEEPDPKLQITLNQYKDVVFPYEEAIRDESYVFDQTISIPSFVDRVKGGVKVSTLDRETPEETEKAHKEVIEKMMKIVGATGRPEDATVVNRYQQILRLFRKPQTAA